MKSWQLPVGRWAAWEEGSASDIKASLAAIDPMLRRRLSPLARGALHVATVCCAGLDSVRLVFASRHGELRRTVESLQSLAAGEPVSPMHFSLSVLNAAAGIFSIARNDKSATTAISAGTETFGFGLMEAYARFQAEPGTPLLFVYADEPAPEPLGRQRNDPPQAMALALLVDPQATGVLRTTIEARAGAPDQVAQALACKAALEGGAASWATAARVWSWDWH